MQIINTINTSVFDVEAVMVDFTPDELNLWEFSIDVSTLDIGSESTENKATSDNLFTNKSITLENLPKNEKSAISDLYDMEKYNELISKIELSNISSEDKKFLVCVASYN